MPQSHTADHRMTPWGREQNTNSHMSVDDSKLFLKIKFILVSKLVEDWNLVYSETRSFVLVHQLNKMLFLDLLIKTPCSNGSEFGVDGVESEVLAWYLVFGLALHRILYIHTLSILFSTTDDCVDAMQMLPSILFSFFPTNTAVCRKTVIKS